MGASYAKFPVGFKWFAPGLFDGTCCFGGEESAGASFLRRDGTVWTTDKDGIIMDLLAAEITARTGKDPGEHFRALVDEFGMPLLHAHRCARQAEQKAKLGKLSPESVKESTLAGEPIIAKLTRAPGNDAPIGGLKVVTATAGLPRGHQAPRTSTRFMRRASKMNRIWTPSSPRRSRLSTTLCGRHHPYGLYPSSW